MNTPWGQSDNEEVIADGIVIYFTPGHGGIKLSPARQQIVKQKFPNFKPFAGAPWYEEDCDVAVVVAAFPECFSPEALGQALNSIRNNRDYFKIDI